MRGGGILMWREIANWWRAWWRPGDGISLRRGRLGESAARVYLEKSGLVFLMANYRSRRGEIDLVFRDRDCLVFVEVKARSDEERGRPASAVDRRKRRLLTRAALDYVRSLKTRTIKTRFDVVEVLLSGDCVREVRHLPDCFPMSSPYRLG